MMLADLGADVIRIDRPEEGPLAALSRLDPTGRGRRSLRLDMKHPRAAEVMDRLLTRSSALIEGFRPGVMERLGLGPDYCLEVNPTLVYGRMTGWGQDGPLATTAGHDITYLAVTGTLSAIGTADRPLPPLNFIADYGGGAMLLLVGVLAALDHAARTGQGQVVDAAMVDGVALLGAMIRGGLAGGWWREGRQRNLLDGGAPFYRTYRTADDQFVAVGALEPQFYARLLEGLGLAEADLPSQQDEERWPELAARFQTVFSSLPLTHWIEVFAGSDACVAPVHSWDQALADPHLKARSTFFQAAGVNQPAPAPRFSVSAATTDGVPVPAGAHSRQVLDHLGYSEDDISKLFAERVAS